MKIVTKCLNCKCRSDKIRYDKAKHVLHCDKCKTKWKVKPYPHNTPHCPECNSEDIVYDEDMIHCGTCGLVLSMNIPWVGGDELDLPWGLLL